MSDNPLANAGDLAKPFDTLVKKIAKGVGALYEPRRIRNVAEAEAEASKIKAESEIEITDLHRRAEQRRIEEEAKHQKNMEDITAKAAPHLNKDANPDAIEDDWIANFFDRCRIVSDGEMQSLWSRVLAGEANTPGTYSKRTVNFVSELDKSDAELFTTLCGFCWNIGYVVPLVFDEDTEIYTTNRINFDALSHLESIGLIQHALASGHFVENELPEIINACYYGKCLRLKLWNNRDHLRIGKVLFTKIGKELAPISGSQPIEGFYEYVKSRWYQYLLDPQKQ